MKSYAADVTDKTNQVFCMPQTNKNLHRRSRLKLLVLCNSFGDWAISVSGLFDVSPTDYCIVGPLVGGLFARPCTEYHICSEDSLFGRYPYLLPNIVPAVVSAVGIVLLWYGLPNVPKKQKYPCSTRLTKHF